ncbi:uncharacterized protein LOC110960721 isoform X1 [Acanthochromis polyacanthus]|uniref:uncharacterized protein LOC110960721 isoform X1 n=1 Tax=Acanthochromis polyacanthus TaxID=80966 RepID=UPI002234C6C3|nr:uncharacterized protein LOC110960721 isoform X1 [Acanthochromis polyacanthus]
MKVFHTFFCFLFIALQDGNTGCVDVENEPFRRLEGEDITVRCSFAFSGHTKFFCREKCEEGNILIKTTKNNDQRGRYRIRYESKSFLSDDILHVSIKHLKKSDSGWYRCTLGRSWFPDSSEDFQIVVTEASTTSQPKSTLPTFPPSTFLPSSSTATTPTEESLSSTSGTSKPPSASSEDTRKQDFSPPSSDLQLSVGLVLVIMIFILSIALMIFCKKRRSTKPKGPPAETNYAEVTESSRVYDEIREDRQISSPPVETSSIYCNAKYTKPNRAEDTDDYSFVSFPPSKSKDDSSELDYTEVDFTNVAASSLNSAPCGDVDNVLYSRLQMNVRSANNTREASAPLYSTVALHR